MRMIFTLLSLVLLACSIEKQPYLVTASSAMKFFKESFFKNKIQEAHFYYTNAIKELKKGSNFNLLAKAYLTKCALDMAALNWRGCPKFLDIKKLVEDKGSQDYYNFLTGKFKHFSPHSSYYKDYVKDDFQSGILEKETYISRAIAFSVAIPNEGFKEEAALEIIRNADFYGHQKIAGAWRKALLLLYKKTNSKKQNVIEKEIQMLK